MVSWESLIFLKENRKTSDRIVRGWAKNQVKFEILEKILVDRLISQWKIVFFILYPVYRKFIILYNSGK